MASTLAARPPARRAVPPRERLAPLRADRWAWWGPLLVAALAGLLRGWRLGTPPSLVFDEVYYAQQGESLLRYGVEVAEDGTPQYVVHPPVGKWVIGSGQWLVEGAVGWRLAVAVLGTLSVLMLARTARRLFRSTLLGCVAGLLLALDGLAIVSSRTALLDPVLTFFLLAAFGALLVDRDRVRERFAAGLPPGARLGLRPWRLAAGVALGLACATKWSGLYALAAFGLMTVLWDVAARRSAGSRTPWAHALRRDAPPAFLALVGTSLVVYVASWAGWFAAGPDTAYGRDRSSGPGPDALWSLLSYHRQVLGFHGGLDSPHPYESHPWSWLVLGRPTSFFFEELGRDQGGCEVERCAQAVLGVGTPAVWWAAALSLPVLLVLWAAGRDWRAGAVLAGVAASYLPWFYFAERTIFSFYTVAFLPWLVLAVTLVLGLVLGGPGATPRRRTWGAAAVGAYLLLVVANTAWLYPVLTAQVIPYGGWADRVAAFLPSWV